MSVSCGISFYMPLTCELVESDLHLKGSIAVLLIHPQVGLLDKGNLLVGSLGAQYIAYGVLMDCWQTRNKV